MKSAFLLITTILFFTCRNIEKKEAQKVIVPDTIEVKKTELPKPEPLTFAPDYDTSQWVELISLDSSIVLDLKYATNDNFVKEQLYNCARCFLRKEAARQLVKANKKLMEYDYRFKMLDCYRPLPIQQRLWDKFQNASYVTPPSKGSMHNRGLAVDLTIIDSDGIELNMGTTYDFFGKEAHHTYTAISDSIFDNRRLLKKTMESVGFKPIRTEWWHYSYSKKMYALSDMEWKCGE